VGAVHGEGEGALGAERELGGGLGEGVERDAHSWTALVQVEKAVGTNNEHPAYEACVHVWVSA